MRPVTVCRWLVLAALHAGLVQAGTVGAPSAEAGAQLLELQGFVGREGPAPPADGLQSGDCSVRLLSAALHYRREPDKYRNDFFAALVIDDYAERAKGHYNMVSASEAAVALETAMVAPAGVTDERVRRVVGFCALRDRNLWAPTPTHPRISLARMMRGAALASLLEGTDEDPVAIANAIDAQTASRPRD